MSIVPFEDTPPGSDVLTAYDLAHLDTYIQLLDAEKAPGTSWQHTVETLFGIDAAREPVRAHQVHEAHHARARWLTEVGYRELAGLEMRRGESPKKD